MKLKALKKLVWCLETRRVIGFGKSPSSVRCPECGKSFLPFHESRYDDPVYGVPAHKKFIKVDRKSNRKERRHPRMG